MVHVPLRCEISPLHVAPVEMTVGRVWSVSLRQVLLRREISPLRFAAVEMTVGREATASFVSFGMTASCLPLCHLEQRYMSVWEVVCRDSIETQSREISGHNACYTIEA